MALSLVKWQLYLEHGYIREIGMIINDCVVLCLQYHTLRVTHGYCSEVGIRPSMEDTAIIESQFNAVGSQCTSQCLSIYAIFDGHGGKECAEYCAANLTQILTKHLSTQMSVDIAFNSCIAELDKKVIEFARDESGSSCCVVLIDHKTFELWCCNVGDSRCILIDNDCAKVEQLSIEHKPDNPLETQRIKAADGWVTFGHLCGILTASRSLGDKSFKFISTPDIIYRKLLSTDRYIIIGCDGLFDVYTNEQCLEWMKSNIGIDVDGDSLQNVTEKLCHCAVHIRRSKDNVSVIIVAVC